MIGIVFGGFCPLHRGHLDVIFRAKKECEKVYLFVCGCDDENDRGMDIGLPLEKRTRLIRKFFEGDEIITVRELNDTKLGIDESMSDSNWEIWTQGLLSLIDEDDRKCGLRFYFSEMQYTQQLERLGHDFVLCRRENPVSGTECRRHPLKQWSQITKEFRPYFCRNILIIGAASEGKTTLCQDLGKYFNCPVSREVGRDRIELTGKKETDLDVNDFISNLYEQNKLNERLISESESGVFISDTDNMVSLMYAAEFVRRKYEKLSKEEYENILLPLACAMSRKIRWRKVFIVKPGKNPYVDDGMRSLDYSSDEDRLEFFETLVSICDKFGYEYEIISGTYYENYLAVRNYIRKLYDERSSDCFGLLHYA